MILVDRNLNRLNLKFSILFEDEMIYAITFKGTGSKLEELFVEFNS